MDEAGVGSAVGGAGGYGTTSGAAGGEGGLGRIRLSVLECSAAGSFDPPLAGFSCTPDDVATPERVYVGTYPN